MKTVGILCGGDSSEYDISVMSATMILNNLPKNVIGYLISVKNNNFTVHTNENDTSLNTDDFSFDLNGDKIKIDFVHIYIHGNPGENGKLQAFLDLKEIPYINTNALVSELSFDKWYCNQFLSGFGINVAKSILLRKTTEYNKEEVISELGLPLFVKPTDSGSSYGVSKVKSIDELDSAIKEAFNEGKTVILESFLDGIEIACAAYENKNGIQSLPLTEISTENDFFDYEAKYDGKSQEITPARISDDITIEIQEITKRIYSILGMESLARMDFMLVNNTPYVIEVNSIPGFSAESIVPKMLAAANITISKFWTEIYEKMMH